MPEVTSLTNHLLGGVILHVGENMGRRIGQFPPYIFNIYTDVKDIHRDGAVRNFRVVILILDVFKATE